MIIIHLFHPAASTMTEKANALIKNPDSAKSLSQFTQSLEHVLNHIHQVQAVLEEVEGGGGSLSAHTQPTMAIPAAVQTHIPDFQPVHVPPPTAKVVDHGTSTSEHHRFYGTLSPSDDWITSSSPTSFYPTISPSPRSDLIQRQESFSEGFSQSYSFGDAETQTPRVRMKDEALQAVLYPGTLGAMSITNPSIIVGQSWSSSSEGLSISFSIILQLCLL